MKYIGEKEFSNQPKEVREVFIKWWKPGELDAFICINGLLLVKEYYEKEGLIRPYKNNRVCVCKDECTPLLTLQHLIDFIEEKTGGVIEIKKVNECIEYLFKITIVHPLGEEYTCWFSESVGLLQAMWSVACEVAKVN